MPPLSIPSAWPAVSRAPQQDVRSRCRKRTSLTSRLTRCFRKFLSLAYTAAAVCLRAHAEHFVPRSSPVTSRCSRYLQCLSPRHLRRECEAIPFFFLHINIARAQLSCRRWQRCAIASGVMQGTLTSKACLTWKAKRQSLNALISDKLREYSQAAARQWSALQVQTGALKLCTLEDLQIENTFVDDLPADPELSNVPRQVFGALHTATEPTPVSTVPTLVHFSREACELLGLDHEETSRPEFSLIFSGCASLPGGKPYAQCYGGHQFGSWAGQLGDGRAISIGEVVNAGKRWELQLKGAGKTPYSRFADGRAVMRSSIREFVASEALFHLGIPTTRALSIVATNTTVPRDMFYNGNVQDEPGAVVCRVSPSFVRFGTFQLPVSRGADEAHLTTAVADYVIKHHFSKLASETNPYLKMLETVVERTAELVVKWQMVGFVHGVLNTDNCSILGLTIDYGPYGFLDVFDPSWTPNLTDMQGRRYCYQSQPQVMQWNLAQLASAFLAADLCTKEEAQVAIDEYGVTLVRLHGEVWAAKLGLASYDEPIATSYMKLMAACESDFTNTFRALMALSHEQQFSEMPASLEAACGKDLTDEDKQEWVDWLNRWRAALEDSGVTDAARREAQGKVNPVYVPRQHLLQVAIEAAEKGDYGELETLMDVLRRPYDEQEGMDRFAQGPPPEMVRPGVSMLSCSS
eukprot:jgi/Ulvmu1/7463/UM037_0006.1